MQGVDFSGRFAFPGLSIFTECEARLQGMSMEKRVRRVLTRKNGSERTGSVADDGCAPGFCFPTSVIYLIYMLRSGKLMNERMITDSSRDGNALFVDIAGFRS